MTKITAKDQIDAIAANDLIYVRDASAPSNPDKKATGAQVLNFTADLSGAVEITPADDDRIAVNDVSDGAAPRKYLPWSKFRPAGAKITNHFRFAGNITVPTLAAGDEGDATITVTGAATGDHVVFNMEPPANIAILASWVSAADTVKVRFRNTHASSGYSTAAVACVALVSRSTA